MHAVVLPLLNSMLLCCVRSITTSDPLAHFTLIITAENVSVALVLYCGEYFGAGRFPYRPYTIFLPK